MSSSPPALADADRAGAEPGPLHRLHPLSPVLRGYKYFVGALGVASVPDLMELGVRRALIGMAIIAPTALVGGLAIAWLSWRFTWYRIEGRELHLESGVLFRRSRRVPLERVQAIDIVRPLVARVLGLAELRLEVVGHGATEAPLAYLSEPEARLLRTRLMALAGGAEEHALPPDEAILARVPTRDLVVSLLLTGEVVVGLPVLLLVGSGLFVVDTAAFFVFLPVLALTALAVGRVLVRRLLVEYGFVLGEAADGLRLRHGLLETRTQTVPPGRVQALRVIQPVLWRRRDWVRVEIDVAGYGAGDGEQLVTRALLPVAPRGLADQLLSRVLAGADVGTAPRRPVPARAAWLDPVQRRNLAIAVTPQVVVVTRGRLHRIVDAIPLARVQSLRLRQGPLERRLRLASVHIDTAGRHVVTRAAHRDQREALVLVEEIGDLARAERHGDRRGGQGLGGAGHAGASVTSCRDGP